MRKRLSSARFRIAAPCLLVGGGTALFLAYLLRRFPYDGLYGVDAYAYYYQARAILNDLLGKSPDPNALFDANGLGHWPIGYHLHIIAGFLFGGEGIFGPHVLTIATAVLCPLLVYALMGIFTGSMTWAARFVGGLVSAAILPLTATYTRTGLSLMSDVPALFWTLLAVYSFLKLYPPESAPPASEPARRWWAITFGGALGLAVLMRYGAGVIILPLFVYFIGRHWLMNGRRDKGVTEPRKVPLPIYSVSAFVVALSPQIWYLATHTAGNGTSDFLSSMSLDNILAYGSSGPDGTVTFPQSMAGFYLFNPLWDTAGGFLSVYFVPCSILGLAWLVWSRRWASLLMLVSWWLLPGLVFASTLYQAHRFALLYLPAIALLIGLGVGAVAQWLARGIASRDLRTTLALSASALVIAALLGMGTVQCWRSVRDWVATHAQWQAQDQQVAAMARSAAQAAPSAPGAVRQPSAISFGATAAIYHYTLWPVLELYNSDPSGVGRFVAARAGLGPIVVAVPLQSLQTQWRDKPLGATWSWLAGHYTLMQEGTSGAYTIFLLDPR